MSTTPAQGWRPLSELVRDLRKIAAMAPLELVGEPAQRPAMAEAMMPPAGHQRDQRTAALVLALRHLTVLSLLLEAAGTPLETRDESGQGKRPSPGKSPAKGQGWTVRYVSLSKASTPVATGGGGGSSAPADTTRLQAETVSVRGHLKRQPYGPGGTMRRTVYVAGYSARRWVAPETTVRVT